MDKQTLTELLARYPMKGPFVFLTGSPTPMDAPEFFRRWLEVYPGVKQLIQYVNEAMTHFM